jgi:1,4-alpha-glucan branching enzyme
MRTKAFYPVAALLAAAMSPAQTDPITGGGNYVYPPGAWVVTTIRAENWHGRLDAAVVPRKGNPDIYVRFGAAPTLTQYDARSINAAGPDSVTIQGDDLRTGTYYVGVYAKTSTAFTSSRTVAPAPSTRPGMGATPYAGGVTFRTWAPFATQVNIAGQFNSWNGNNAVLASEGNGFYSMDFRGATAGQQYKWVVRNGAQTLWKNDPWARRLTSSVGNSIVYNPNGYQWQNQNFQTPPWNEMVIYQVHIGAFNDTPGGGPGTFATAEQKLDYLQSLGVNAIQLLPISEFPGDFSWGYNPSYPWSVEAAYGGPDALKGLIDKAQTRGISVLFDLVHNHYGPTDLDMWRYDGWSQGTYGGVFFYNDARAVTPWGNTRPDFGRGPVRSYIRDNALMWAEEFRVAGFRWDSTLNIRRTDLGDNADGWSLLQWINDSLDATQPWKINIAEDLQNNDWITRPTSQGGAGFDAQWSNFVHTLKATMRDPSDSGRNMFSLRDQLNERFNGDAWKRVIYTESHDENANGKQRPPSEIDPANPGSYWARKRSTLGATMVFTAPGIPKLFMGQEFLEDGWFADNDPLDWTKTTTYAGISQLYKDLIRLRRNLDGQTRGLTGQSQNVFHVNNTDKLIAYHRWDQGGTNDDVVVVLNWANRTWNSYTIGLPRGGNWSVVFNSDWTGYSPDYSNVGPTVVGASNTPRDGLAYSGTVSIGPYSALILKKD